MSLRGRRSFAALANNGAAAAPAAHPDGDGRRPGPGVVESSAPGVAGATTSALPHSALEPLSPRSHRTLRRLQSAHTLGTKATFLQGPATNASSKLNPNHNHRNSNSNSNNASNTDAVNPSAIASTNTNTYPNTTSALSNINNTQAHTLDTSTSIGSQHHQPGHAPRILHTRTRQVSFNHHTVAGSVKATAAQQQTVGKRLGKMDRTNATANTMSIDRLLRDGPPDDDICGALESLRLKVLDQGIKSDSDGMSATRIYVWLLLLDAPTMRTDDYLALVHRGASPAYSKIRNDTFRTLTTDPLFRRRVSEASLIRLLNAIAWKLHDARLEKQQLETSRAPSVADSVRTAASATSSVAPSAHSSPAAKNRARALTLTTEGSDSAVAAEPGTYVQGMNVLAAPFLYAARSEAEAFVAFHMLLTRECPGYIRGAMDGVHKGLALVDKVLAIVDPRLAMHLTAKGMSAEIYAFPSVLTLCACTPPLPEVLRLWDFLFAYGPHLNILCVVAQLVLIRSQILESQTPNKVLRSFPTLHADQIKQTTLAIIKMIPDDVYAEIVNHAK